MSVARYREALRVLTGSDLPPEPSSDGGLLESRASQRATDMKPND